jgi:phosphoribosyl 1,2-cyclic phosphate phosphodiesterase
MDLLILGSGGAQPPPRPGCKCNVCVEAREKGIPYYRTGPSLYLPKENILFDLPEEIREQLNREKIGHVEHVFLSHWHPDHSMGIRLFEQMNYNFHLKPSTTSTLYISKETEHNLGIQLLPSYIPLYTRRKIIELKYLTDGNPIFIGDIAITPYSLPNSDTFIYTLEEEDKKVIYAPCDIRHFPIRDELMNPNLLILHLGFFEELVPDGILYEQEDSFEEDLVTIDRLNAKKTLFMHIEEAWGKSYDDYKRMEKELRRYRIEFAYDGMVIQI